MRTLPAAVETATTKAVTKPVYLVEFGWGDKLSSSGDVIWNGQNWMAAGMEVRIDGRNVRITLNDPTNAPVSRILSGSDAGQAVSVYVYYEGDAVLVFSGAVTSSRVDDSVVTYEASAAADIVLYPSGVITHDVFHHVPPPGTLFKLGKQVLIIQ